MKPADVVQPDPLEMWGDGLAVAFSVLRHPRQFISGPPASGGSPQDRLNIFLAAWKAAGVQGNVLEPVTACAREWSSRADRDAVFELTKSALLEIEHGMADALDAGATCPQLVRTADFGSGLSRMTAPHLGAGVYFAVGWADALPETHPLLAAIPPDDRFLSDRRQAFVLGPMEPHIVPRRFYDSATAVALTLQFRQEQKRRELEREEADRREAERRVREFWSSPDGEAERQRIRNRQLHEQGKVPAYVPPEPAVRINGR